MKINKSGFPNFLSWLSAGNQRTVPTRDHKYFTVYPWKNVRSVLQSLRYEKLLYKIRIKFLGS